MSSSQPPRRPAAGRARSSQPSRRAPLAAVYARTAAASHEGIADQVLACRTRAERDGYHVPDDARFCFTDDGVAGSGAARPAFEALLDLVRRGEAPFTRVYVRDRTRLGRSVDPRDLSREASGLEGTGVSVRYATDPADDAAPLPAGLQNTHARADDVAAVTEQIYHAVGELLRSTYQEHRLRPLRAAAARAAARRRAEGRR